MSRKCNWLLGVLAVVGCLFPLMANAEDKENPVVAAARSRQARVKTLAVEFSETEILAKGGRSTEVGAPFDGGTQLPPQELTLKSQSRLLIAGDKVRYENNHPYWDNLYAADGTPLAVISIRVRDGSSVSMFFPNGPRGISEPWALLHCDKLALTTRGSIHTNVVALMLATVRGFDPAQLVWHLDQFEATGHQLILDGATCLEYTGPVPHNGHFIRSAIQTPLNLTYRYWLDAGRDFVIRRGQTLEEDRVLEQVDVHYRRDDVAGWFPDTWEYCEFSKAGDVLKTVTVAVLSVRFNEEAPADAFTLPPFPEGTLVADNRHHKTYHVVADGSWREDDPPAGDAPPGPPPSTPWYLNQYVLVGAATALASAFVGVYWLRRPKKP